ncbi:MAG TPA: HisA/HisF-related TIM barrel protein [Terriglobales bacterium]|nr:HisA/HisF-related TIM barrel protein [Terriglobales bacterium]
MLIPAIDFQAGAVVQLVQGERWALERALEPTLAWLRGFPWLQVVDLDAAKNEGENCVLVERCCRAGFRVRVGGGVRSLDRARALLDAGAEQVIVGSAAFAGAAPNREFLEPLQSLGRERIVVAVDARGGQVVTHGWRQPLPLSPVEAVQALAPWAGGFLYTHVDTEGLMAGIPLDAVAAVRAASPRPLGVAGGISDMEQIAALTGMGCDCVLGMAIYTGTLSLEELRLWAGAGAQ